MKKLTEPKIQTQIMNGAEIVLEVLKNQQTDKLFGYPGSAILKLYDEMSKANAISHFLMRHEQAAIHAAEGYSRASGKTGVVTVTSGPGLTNTITGLMNAYADGFPLVLIAGLVTKELLGTECFQDVDIRGITSSCCKKTYIVSDIKDLQSALEEAFIIAQSGKKGPVVVGITKNVFDEKSRYTKSETTQHPLKYEINSKAIIELINSASKPLILVGGGCINASNELKMFVKSTNIPVVTTLMGRGNFPETDPLFIGMTGQNGSINADKMLNDCDLLIALGTRYNNRFGNISGKIIRVNIEHKSFGNNNEHKINCDVKSFLQVLIELKISTKKNWVKKSITNPEFDDKGTCFTTKNVIKTLYEQTKKINPTVVTEVGHHQIITSNEFKFDEPRKFITSGGLGTMGFGFPAGIGACIANPKETVIVIAGDGSIQMNIQELATCFEYKIPIKIVIINNRSLALIKQQQKNLYDSRYYQSDLINPDFVKLADAYGIKGMSVSNLEDLSIAVETMIKQNEAFVLEAITTEE